MSLITMYSVNYSTFHKTKVHWAVSFLDDLPIWHLAVGERGAPVKSHQPVRRDHQLPVISLETQVKWGLTFHPSMVNCIACLLEGDKCLQLGKCVMPSKLLFDGIHCRTCQMLLWWTENWFHSFNMSNLEPMEMSLYASMGYSCCTIE